MAEETARPASFEMGFESHFQRLLLSSRIPTFLNEQNKQLPQKFRYTRDEMLRHRNIKSDLNALRAIVPPELHCLLTNKRQAWPKCGGSSPKQTNAGESNRQKYRKQRRAQAWGKRGGRGTGRGAGRGTESANVPPSSRLDRALSQYMEERSWPGTTTPAMPVMPPPSNLTFRPRPPGLGFDPFHSVSTSYLPPATQHMALLPAGPSLSLHMGSVEPPSDDATVILN